jgi:hypothetical protein
MQKTLMLTVVLLISAIGLQAQAMGQAGGNSSASATITGCLQFTDGHYRLTDNSGKVYQLSGEANKLTHYIGQQVAIAGMPGVRTGDTTVQGSESTAKEQAVFRVKTVQHLADTCKAAGN